MGTVSDDSALLVAQDRLLAIHPQRHRRESATITYCAWDTTSGTGRQQRSTPPPTAAARPSAPPPTPPRSPCSYASLSGYVYLDPANSGIRVSSSKGLGGVTVRLLLENSSGTFTEVAGKLADPNLGRRLLQLQQPGRRNLSDPRDPAARVRGGPEHPGQHRRRTQRHESPNRHFPGHGQPRAKRAPATTSACRGWCRGCTPCG